jgi:hypothetical protein
MTDLFDVDDGTDVGDYEDAASVSKGVVDRRLLREESGAVKRSNDEEAVSEKGMEVHGGGATATR